MKIVCDSCKTFIYITVTKRLYIKKRDENNFEAIFSELNILYCISGCAMYLVLGITYTLIDPFVNRMLSYKHFYTLRIYSIGYFISERAAYVSRYNTYRTRGISEM